MRSFHSLIPPPYTRAGRIVRGLGNGLVIIAAAVCLIVSGVFRLSAWTLGLSGLIVGLVALLAFVCALLAVAVVVGAAVWLALFVAGRLNTAPALSRCLAVA